jgi:WD40 repeat protein
MTRPAILDVSVPQADVNNVAFGPNQHTMATAHNDGKIRIWDLTTLNDVREHATDRACQLTGRGLDQIEWDRNVSGLPYRKTCP